MSIRIQNDSLTGTAASQSNRTQDVVQIGGSDGRNASRIGGTSDRVEISSLSGKIADSLTTSEPAQSARVRQLAALYSSGRYQLDSMALSRAIVSQAIQAGGLEGD